MKKLTDYSASELIEAIQNHPDVLCASVWTMDDVRNWVDQKAEDIMIGRDMLTELPQPEYAKAIDRIVEEARAEKNLCAVAELDENNWNRMDDFMGGVCRECNAKLKN